MRTRGYGWWVVGFLTLAGGAAEAAGTRAYTRLTNRVRVFAVNAFVTNEAVAPAVVVAAIHGIVEAPHSNAFPGFFAPGETKSFRFSLTNRANRAEEGLVLVLTNLWMTNACGVWGLRVYAEDVELAATNTGFVAFGAFRVPVTNRIPPDGVFSYRLDVTASAAPDPGCSLSVGLVASVLSNVTSYTAGGFRYGGKTNILRTVSASVALPLVALTKSVGFLTNRRFGGYGLTPGCEITYVVRFSNMGNGPGRNLRIEDLLPARFVEVETLTPAAFSGLATNMSVEYSALPAGGGWQGLPGGEWRTNLRRIRFIHGGDVPVAGKGEIRYRVRIR